MELKYLKTIKTILETGSFQNAARKLSYTQSTVTFQIQQLEQELAVKLFERIGRRMVLTQAGKDLMPYVDSILLAVENLESYGKTSDEIAGTLRVSMPETLLTYKMQPLLKAFREQAPNVNLSLQTMNCYAIRDQIISGGLDIAIHYDIGGYGSSVNTEIIADFSMVLVSSPDFNSELCDFASSHQRKQLCHIRNDSESVFQQIFDQYLQSKDIIIEQKMELGSIEAIKRSVMSNLGVAFLPRFTVVEELNRGMLKEIKADYSESRITVLCAYHKNKWISPAMELFIRLMKECLAY